MIDYEILKPENKDSYIEFLINHFSEDINPESIQNSANKEIDCMFSDYFRAPIFYSFYKDGQLIGTSGIIREWVAPNTYSIFWVCSHRDHRQQGIGSHIINTTIDDCANHQLNGEPGTLILYCLEHNIDFYQRFGFEQGPKGHHWVFMSKPVNNEGL